MPYTTIIAAASLAKLDGCAIFDCRFDLRDPAAGRRGYIGGHIPGASYLDLEFDLSGTPEGTNGRHPLPDRDALARKLAAAGLRRTRQVVAYDDAGGAFAARLWWLLRWLGHPAVAVLDGGIQAWSAASLPLAEGDVSPVVRGDFVPSPVPAMPTVDAAAILAGRLDGTPLVIDARSPSRFRGEPDPLDPVAGHIPGAVNRFFRDNLAADGLFKPADMLAQDYRALIGVVPPESVVLQCGSGVTATHDLLAMAHAGLPGASLYPGSWSEWISDPARPVERGSGSSPS